MTFIEFIGFLIALLALSFSVLRRLYEESQKRKDPERYEKEQEAKRHEAEAMYRELMRSLDMEVDENDAYAEPLSAPERPPEPPPRAGASSGHLVTDRGGHRQLSADFELHTNIEDRNFDSKVENRRYKTRIKTRYDDNYGQQLVDPELQGKGPVMSQIKGRTTCIKRLLDGLPSKQLLIIASEVIGPPKSMR